MSRSPSTPLSLQELERAVLDAALKRFAEWCEGASPRFREEVFSGKDTNLQGGKKAGEMIRACHALHKATNT